jgi:hypothetical protein
MTKLLQLRVGLSDDLAALQPRLSDCIESVLGHASALMQDVIQGLEAAALRTDAQRNPLLQEAGSQSVIGRLRADAQTAGELFRSELHRAVHHGGGRDQPAGETLRFQDLGLFEDTDLHQSIEIARAQQEVVLAVEDVLPAFNAVASALMGWSSIQPDLNPLRPDVFVRALQATLVVHVPDGPTREKLILPAAGLMGVRLARIYRELTDWLRSSGVVPAMSASARAPVVKAGAERLTDAVSRTLLNLERLRKLLAGDFDGNDSRRAFPHTVPASLETLQELQQVDALMARLEQRTATAPDLKGQAPDRVQPGSAPRMGHQLGAEVVGLMFENLYRDPRLLPKLKRRLRKMETAFVRIAREDSRFFSDRDHPARRLIAALTQRCLAFKDETDDGCRRYMNTVDESVHWLTRAVPDADLCSELLRHLQGRWARHDQAMRARNAEAARALMHAEQRYVLARKIASDLSEAMEGMDVAGFVRDFLQGPWAQVVAEARLSSGGVDDPFGYRTLADDLIWSVQKKTARRGRVRRLAQMVPALVTGLRQGLARIDYPQELTAAFFSSLEAIHRAALEEGRNAALQAAADAAEAAPSRWGEPGAEAADPWLAETEAQESGYYSALPESTESAQLNPTSAPAPAPLGNDAVLRTGTWVELKVESDWVRVQLTWASPHATLFMFTSQGGSAHSMSRRTLDRLRAEGAIRIVADRPVIDEALDQVAKAALRNSASDKS